jgi:hypothetical protein
MPITILSKPKLFDVHFDQGSFDSWCVYLSKPNQARYAPKDVEYFTRLNIIGGIYDKSKLYNDFVSVYTSTTKQINSAVLNIISQVSSSYGTHSLEVEIWFIVIYAGMIAEENKEHAVLKKRIKRLGMHQVLMDGIDPSVAANFSKGKKWQELDIIMKTKGF